MYCAEYGFKKVSDTNLCVLKCLKTKSLCRDNNKTALKHFHDKTIYI